ncbi:MAG: energy-coupling factor transporter ATPase [bacterium]|nr:energy-coupling factor transporter ATPase [bacterium]
MIILENVSYTYNRGRPDVCHALHDVSLEIPDGSITAVIGHTGSGKSTLIQLLNGIEKPDSGRVLVNGTEVTAKDTDMRALRFRVGMVMQYPEYQLFEETVERDIAFGPGNMGLGESEIKERVFRAAELVGLSGEELKKSPFELSGGQKRRAAIAGVIAMEPEVLVMDEPAAGLDPKGRSAVFELIRTLHLKRPDMIIIFVSHSMEDVAATAERVIVMNNGSAVMNDETGRVFSRGDELKTIGLDVPQMAVLCSRLRKAGFNIPEGIYTVEAAVENLKRVLIND